MLAFFVGRYVFVMVGGNISAHPYRAGVRLILPISLRYARLLGDYGIPIGHRLRPATKS